MVNYKKNYKVAKYLFLTDKTICKKNETKST